jgi:ribosomal protein S18 acetylase RimI-like enzyme
MGAIPRPARLIVLSRVYRSLRSRRSIVFRSHPPGLNAAALWVSRDNLRARRFYERYGGKVVAEREDVRDGTVLVELAYGWRDFRELDRLLSRE